MLYDFGPRLLKLRKDKNLTQQMVVERAKGFDPNLRLSDSVLGKYESDLAVPRLTEAAALADVLNVSLDYLTSGEKCNVLSLKELSPEQVQLLMKKSWVLLRRWSFPISARRTRTISPSPLTASSPRLHRRRQSVFTGRMILLLTLWALFVFQPLK